MEYTILVRFDATNDAMAREIYALMREAFCNQTNATEVDALLETNKGKLLNRLNRNCDLTVELCSACGAEKLKGQSCGCFDNNCQ